jgi:hypothetical protein
MSDDSTAPDIDERYLIRYPSGKTFTCSGRFHKVVLGDLIAPAIVPSVGPVVMLDQRAIVEKGDQQVYSPRRNMDGLQPDIRRWLASNPSWGK